MICPFINPTFHFINESGGEKHPWVHIYNSPRRMMYAAAPQNKSITKLPSTMACTPVIVKSTTGTSRLTMMMTPINPARKNIKLSRIGDKGSGDKYPIKINAANPRNNGDMVINNFRYLSQ
jgi:hypothetical protein